MTELIVWATAVVCAELGNNVAEKIYKILSFLCHYVS